MTTPVVTAPGLATLSPKLGGAVLVSKVGAATLIAQPIRDATLAAQPILDAHITTTLVISPAVAVVGSAVVGTSTVG